MCPPDRDADKFTSAEDEEDDHDKTKEKADPHYCDKVSCRGLQLQSLWRFPTAAVS